MSNSCVISCRKHRIYTYVGTNASPLQFYDQPMMELLSSFLAQHRGCPLQYGEPDSACAANDIDERDPSTWYQNFENSASSRT